ncbi:unnamed protein product [Caenorhabditis angaria]|uniref:Uncharacterized protein n=1 Tax=Caenorhabditis angaria TaxID=860376 RepID=A0A9P1NB95_9PELO|nr:unnamed protein product [Caenorhabditis angaria]
MKFIFFFLILIVFLSSLAESRALDVLNGTPLPTDFSGSDGDLKEGGRRYPDPDFPKGTPLPTDAIGAKIE